VTGAGAGRVWHPIHFPEGYHTGSRGQSPTSQVPFPPRAAPGYRTVGLRTGRRDATRVPACKIVVHTLPPHRGASPIASEVNR
jgi:hypothetical protein